MNISDFKYAILEYTRKINENTIKAFNPFFEKHGLTMLQGRILMALYHFGSHSIGNLADNINIAGANISVMCKRLEKMGYLSRVRDREDERVVKVALTEKGNEIILEIDERLNKVISREFNEVEFYTEIIKGMKKLNNILERIILIDQ